MKVFLFLLPGLILSASAKLPAMSDKTEWLGYFVGWTGSDSDFGIGADGESMIWPRKGREVIRYKEVKVHYLIEENMDGRWVRRQLLDEGGITSENEKGVDPAKPVAIVTTVTGGTRIEWTHVVSRGKINIKPRLIEKKTANDVRVGVEFTLPRMYRFDTPPDERDLKKKVGKDYLRATRLKDNKSVKVSFHEVEINLADEEHLAGGASEVEVQSKGFADKTFLMANGGDKVGRIDIRPSGPIYNFFHLTWMADAGKLGEKECYVSAWVE